MLAALVHIMGTHTQQPQLTLLRLLGLAALVARMQSGHHACWERAACRRGVPKAPKSLPWRGPNRATPGAHRKLML
jgi:hypothetical protein